MHHDHWIRRLWRGTLVVATYPFFFILVLLMDRRERKELLREHTKLLSQREKEDV